MSQSKGNQTPNLVKESVGQSPPDPTLAQITPDQMRDVNLMVDYAVRQGLELPADALQDIALAKTQLTDGHVSAEVSARFIAASAKMARTISPATLKSINFSRMQNPQQKQTPKKIAQRYNTLGIAVFFCY